MKKLAVLSFVVLFACVFSLQASEVATMAKKEKARRDALHREGKTVKTFTNADIGNIKSQLSFEVKAEPAQTRDDDFAQAQEATNEAAKDLAQKVEKEQESQETTELKQERDALEQKAKEAQDTINQGGGYFTRNIGNQFQQKREAEDKIREIDGKLSEQKESENEDNN